MKIRSVKAKYELQVAPKLKICFAATTLLIVELIHTHVLLLYLLRSIIKWIASI